MVISNILLSLQSPVAESPSPDGKLSLQVYTAGQSATPPDYRADARFYLYNPSRLPFFRRSLVGSAPYADGWAMKWSDAHNVTITLGALSYVSFFRPTDGKTTIHLVTDNASPDESRCIQASFENTIDGINCFAHLLNFSQSGISAH
jgi:hypothetical protein